MFRAMPPRPCGATSVTHSADAAPTIVVVTDETLFPTRGGSQARIIALIRSLQAAGFSVVLVSRRLLRPGLRPGIRTTLKTWSLVDCLIQVDASGFGTGSPLAYDCKPFLRPLIAAVQRFKPAAVIAEYIWMAPCLDVVPGDTLRLLDTHDVMHVRRSMYAGQPGEAWWVDCSREEEQALLNKADIVMAIQRHEAEVFRAMLPGKTVMCVPHCCEPQARPLSRRAGGDVVAFIGSKIQGNQIGVRSFLEVSWPIVRRLCHDAHLKLYGDIATCIDTHKPGVHSIGYVRRLTAAYQDAKVIINPVTLGTGLKVKSVEALAYGKALVTTSCGADGLEEGRGQAFLLEDDPERFGLAVARLLRDDPLRSGLEWSALDFARERFGPAAALRELLDAVSARPARAATGREDGVTL
jgi:glycosyltransferase involved in cell wall biosynthesis